jgi:hypothetical protein
MASRMCNHKTWGCAGTGAVLARGAHTFPSCSAVMMWHCP